MNSAVELLQNLIRIPSVNPEGDPGVSNPGEQACAEFLARFLTDCGAAVELREVLPGRPNVLARFPSSAPGKPKILFAPHIDTVSVRGMTIDPFGGEIRDGRIWGRGASDTKGPMASMLWALKEAGPQIADLPYEIWFAGLMGEEAGLFGSKALAEQETYDFVIVGEPTDLKTVFTHKGSSWITLKAHGKSVHASTPHLGVNAIDRAYEVIQALKQRFQIAKASAPHPVLGEATLNVGTIVGGSKINIVPDHCEVCIDIRTVPGLDLESLLEMLRAQFPEVEISATHSSPLYTDPEHPLVKQLAACGGDGVPAPWFCDAASFAAKGIPAVAVGPGSIAQAHTCDEWISVEDLEAGVKFFAAFLRQLA